MPAPVGRLPGPGVDQLFDAVLGGVVELVPAGAEDLDAVVGHRVVRRRDHHAEIGVVRAGQVGHRGGRQNADPQRVDTLAGQPGDHRGLEHLAAGPRVAADDGDATGMTTDAAQPPGRRGAQRQRQLSGQILIGDSAHPVGAEQSTHAHKPLTDALNCPASARVCTATRRASCTFRARSRQQESISACCTEAPCGPS